MANERRIREDRLEPKEMSETRRPVFPRVT